MKILLILGCNGLSDKDRFVYCKSVCNPILKLTGLEPGTKKQVIDFLDKACGLFDGPCSDYNKVVNIINLLNKNFGIIKEENLHKVQAFIKMHRSCGLYLMLMLEEDYYE